MSFVYNSGRIILSIIPLCCMLFACTSMNAENGKYISGLQWIREDNTPKTVVIMPFDNETAEKDMEIQLDINSDIAMCLDRMPLIQDSKKSIKEAVEKTTQWARRCKQHHDKLNKKGQILFAISQGGIHKDLRQQSCYELAALDFEGYSIGGLALGETLQQEMKMVEIHKSIIPEDKVCYLMGEGNPIGIVEAIARGSQPA